MSDLATDALEPIEAVLRGRLGTHEAVMAALDALASVREQLRLAEPVARELLTLAALLQETRARPEGREGIVAVYDSVTGEYLGCMGIETWRAALSPGESDDA